MAIQSSYKKILAALSKGHVRFLVAGGIAMNVHGLERVTYDLDLIIFLRKDNVLKFTGIMKRLGYQPKIPVKPEDFANERLRKQWIEKKNMVVFSYYHPKNPFDRIDIFVYHPRPFDKMLKASKVTYLLEKRIRVAGLKDMLLMKKKASRPKDQFDIRFLENLVRKMED